MKSTFKQRGAFIVLIVSVALLALSSTVEYGKYISYILQCTTERTSSAPCYSSYDGVIFIALGLAVAFCLVGLVLDFFRKFTKKVDWAFWNTLTNPSHIRTDLLREVCSYIFNSVIREGWPVWFRKVYLYRRSVLADAIRYSMGEIVGIIFCFQ